MPVLHAQVAHHFTFHSPPRFGDAFYMVMYQLYLRHQQNMALVDESSDAGSNKQHLMCDVSMRSCVAQ